MPFITRLRTLGGKIEGTPYTAETLAGADYDARLYNIKCSPDIEEIIRSYATGDYARFVSVMGKRSGSISFSFDLAWSGTNATAPEYGKYLKGCGMAETVHGSTGVSYKPSATKNAVPLTLEMVEYDEGSSPVQVVTKLGGCMGNAKIIMDSVGKPIRVDCEFKGALISITDRAYASRITPSGFDQTNPDAVLSSTLTLFGEVQDCDKITIDLGNQVELAVDPADASGFDGARIVDRNTSMVIDPYLDTIAGRGNYARWTGSTTGAFSMTVGSHLTMSAPSVQITKGYTNDERNGYNVNTLTCTLTRTDDDTEDNFEILQGTKV